MTTGLSPRRLATALLLILIALAELLLAFRGPIALTKTPSLMLAPISPSAAQSAGLTDAEREEFIRALEAAFASAGKSSVKPQRFIDEYLAPRGENLQTLADRESVLAVASELGIQRVAQAVLSSWGGELSLYLSVRDSAAGDLIASENFSAPDLGALLAELESPAFADAFAAEVPGMTPFDFSFFLFLGLELLTALLLLFRRERLFNQGQLILGSTLFLFALFFARNANMDYVQRFVAHGGALKLAADTARQQLEVSLRFLPPLFVNLGLYLFSGGPRPGGGPGRAIRSNSSPLRGSGISASIPAALAQFLLNPPTLLAGWLSGALFAFALPSLIRLEGVPVLAFIALVPILWAARRSSAGDAGMGIMAFASLQVMLINFWHSTYSYVSLPFTVLLSMAQWLLFLPLLVFLLRRPGRVWILAVPAAWLAFDWLRGMGFLAYPWGMLGTALYRTIPLIQIASVTGVWGVSWFLFLFNAALTELLSNPRRRMPLFVLAGAFLAPLLFGAGTLVLANRGETETTRLLLVQHNRDPRKHDYAESVDALLRLSKEGIARAYAEGRPVEMVVWPETAFVPDLRYWMRPGNAGRPRRRLAERLFQAADEWGIPLVTGTSDHKRLPGEEDRDYPEISYNSAVIIEPKSGIGGIYHKIKLVPFTEYFPFKDELPGVYAQLDKFDVTEWEPGSEYRVLAHKDFTFATPICFEDIMPDHVRRFVAAGAGAVVNISNDYWSLSSVEGMQHGVNGLFRAVENRIPMVRATTSGLTVGVDPYGRMLGSLPFFEEGALIVDLPAGNPRPSLYTRWGDWFPLLMLLLGIGIMLWELASLFRQRRIKGDLRPSVLVRLGAYRPR